MTRTRDSIPATWPPEQAGAIRRRQTTYWELLLQTPVRGLARVHFVGKREYSFAGSGFVGVSIVSDHAVLADYTQPWTTVYVNSQAPHPISTVETLQRLVSQWSLGWRPFERYANREYGPEQVLHEGTGALLTGPISLARAAVQVLESQGISSIAPESLSCPSSEGDGRRRALRALFLGGSLVVARHFDWEVLSLDERAG